MNEVIKTAVIGILAMVFVLLLKKDSPAYSFLITIGTGVVIIYIAVGLAKPILELIYELADSAGLSAAVLSPLMKALGISVVTKFSAEACRDAKEGAIGAYAEMIGATAAIYVSLPLITTVFKLIKSFLQI